MSRRGVSLKKQLACVNKAVTRAEKRLAVLDAKLDANLSGRIRLRRISRKELEERGMLIWKLEFIFDLLLRIDRELNRNER